MSLIKLNYMYCVLQNVYGSKATISDPDAFKEKIKSIEKAAKNKALKRTNSSASASSHFTGAKSAKSFMTSENGETLGSELEAGVHSDDDNRTVGVRGIEKDPVF